MSEYDRPLDAVTPTTLYFLAKAQDTLQGPHRDSPAPLPCPQDAPLNPKPQSAAPVSPPAPTQAKTLPRRLSPLNAGPSLFTRVEASGTEGPFKEALIRITPKAEQSQPQTAPTFRPLLPAPIPSPVHHTPAVHTTRSNFTQPPAPRVALSFTILETLTACLREAECPATARSIFQTLFELGLETVRARNLPTRPDVAVFHLPVELLASHLEVSRITIWRNLKPLIEAGILANRDHYDTLRGATAISGKIWAISLAPALVMAGKAPHVRVTKDDLAFQWRDLDADARKGRTAYSATRTEAQQALEKAQREAKADKKAEERLRAAARAKDREAARKRGEKPLRGRAAATANAAKTRAENPPPVRKKQVVQQSLDGLKAVSKEELKRWALAPFFENFDVTLTVSRGLGSGRDAIYTLPLLTSLSRRERGAAVEALAQQLAVAFEDHQNVRFWLWLTWQVLRAFDQGQDWSDDIALILSRVLHDIKHDESMRNRSVLRPGALVVNELRNCGLLEALRQISPSRVGVRPKARAA